MMLVDLITARDDVSGAEIKAICTEARLMALRKPRMKVTNEDQKNLMKIFFMKNKKALLGTLSLAIHSCFQGTGWECPDSSEG